MADVLVILIACMVFLSLFLGAKNVFANSFLTCTARLMMMMMNSCCGMVDRREALNLISSRDYCQRFWPSQISDTMPLGFEPTQNLSSDLVGMKWSSSESQVLSLEFDWRLSSFDLGLLAFLHVFLLYRVLYLTILLHALSSLI